MSNKKQEKNKGLGEEDFKYWGEDPKEDEEFMNALFAYMFKEFWLSPEDEEALAYL